MSNSAISSLIEREMSGNISGGKESMNKLPDWPKQLDKIVAGIFIDFIVHRLCPSRNFA